MEEETTRKPVASIAVPLILMMPISAASIAAVTYSVLHRTLGDFLRYGGLIALAFAIFIATSAVLTYKDTKSKRESFRLLALLPVSVAVGAAYYALIAALLDLGVWLVKSWSVTVGGFIAVAICTLFFGLSLFVFRLKYRWVYGLSEAVMGLVLASYKFSPAEPIRTLSDPNFYLAFVVSGVYLVVRGFDNMHQGLYKEPYDPVATALIRWYQSQKASWQLRRKATIQITRDSQDRSS